MKTLEETIDLMESLNGTAYDLAMNSWIAADRAGIVDDDDAEELREEASEEQAMYFRDHFYDLDDSDRDSVLHWLKHDEDFADQFRDWFGHDQFDDEFA